VGLEKSRNDLDNLVIGLGSSDFDNRLTKSPLTRGEGDVSGTPAVRGLWVRGGQSAAATVMRRGRLPKRGVMGRSDLNVHGDGTDALAPRRRRPLAVATAAPRYPDGTAVDVLQRPVRREEHP
jgi:hypothetical protein